MAPELAEPVNTYPLTLERLVPIMEDLRPHDRAELLSLRTDGDLGRAAVELCRMKGNCFVCCTRDDTPIAVIGWLTTEIPGVMVTFLMSTPRIKEIGVGLHRFAMRTHAFLASKGVRRFATMGLESTPDAVRWMLRLGYVLEGRHRKAAIDGSDLFTWARVEES